MSSWGCRWQYLSARRLPCHGKSTRIPVFTPRTNSFTRRQCCSVDGKTPGHRTRAPKPKTRSRPKKHRQAATTRTRLDYRVPHLRTLPSRSALNLSAWRLLFLSRRFILRFVSLFLEMALHSCSHSFHATLTSGGGGGMLSSVLSTAPPAAASAASATASAHPPCRERPKCCGETGANQFVRRGGGEIREEQWAISPALELF